MSHLKGDIPMTPEGLRSRTAHSDWFTGWEAVENVARGKWALIF